MSALILITAAILTLATGAIVVWSNSHRFTNRVFGAFSLISAGWVFCVFMAMRIGFRLEHDETVNPIPWLRAAAAVGAFFPGIVWLLMSSITTAEDDTLKTLRRCWPWLLIAVLLSLLTTTDLYIPADSTPSNPKRGAGYLLYNVITGGSFLFIAIESYRRFRAATGIRRLEMQFLTLNAAVGCLFTIILNGVGSYLDIRPLARLSPLVMLVFYGLTAWAITIHRVFDSRQVFLSVAQRISMVVILSIGTFAGWRLLNPTVPAPFDLVASIALCGSIAFWLDRRSRSWFKLNTWQNTIAIRQNALDLARREPDPNKLVAEFEALLRGWYQTNYAALLFDSGEVYVANNIELAKDRSGYRALCRQGWSTPESLQRLRPEPGLVDLRQFLTEFNLGVIVPAPRGSTTPSLLLALGIKTNFRPFTYPEVQQLQEVAEFMDNILARSRLSMQARQSEQLATIGLIGASLAHEIRNPLVSIKTFSHLLATRFDDPEFRRRFSVLIPAEVERIDSLTQQLLDLSNPRRHQMERVSLHTIMQETADLMLARAQEAKVTLTSQLTAPTDTIHADGSAIRQVLINLIINAFQALESQTGERRVQLRSRNSPNGSIILEVSDNGPGIAPEQRARLFHPFVSTKTKGMGLGLAVCADILHEHRATIIVPDLGRPGATFRITFPCPQPSS
jgi:signal transduction histidine kinase